MEIIFGLVSGIVSSLGMGGGTILILLLSIFLNTEQHIAQATNLVFFVPTSITAIIMNIKNKKINWKVSKDIIIYGVIGAFIGSQISNYLPNLKLKKVFGIFLLFIAFFQIYEIYSSYTKNKKANNKGIKK